MIGGLGLYLNIYYLFDGDKVAGASMNAFAFMFQAGAGFATIFLINHFRSRFDKRTLLAICMGITAVGFLNSIWLYRPSMPILQIVTQLCVGVGLGGFWILINSMKADVCDEDELVTGLRREGTYGAVATWIQKLGMSLSFLLSASILELAGFDIALGGEQTQSTIDFMRYAYASVPAGAAAIAFFLLFRYPLTALRMAEIRNTLEERRGTI